MAGITYDTGALIAAERHDRAMWSFHKAALADDLTPTVPAPVLAEAWRGGARQAGLHRLLRLCAIEPFTGTRARAVGELAAASGHSDVPDLAVVEGALRRGDVVVTSDRGDIAAVAAAAGTPLSIEDV